MNGFLNMPISESTEPTIPMPENMMEMMNYKECCSAMWVKQERYLNHWNSNYYVGIWGGKEYKDSINTVVFPRETFCEIKDEDIELLREIKQWTDNKSSIVELEKKTEIETLKNERLSAMVELLNRELMCLRQNFDETINNHNMKLNSVESELAVIKSSKGWKLLTLLYKIEGMFRKK